MKRLPISRADVRVEMLIPRDLFEEAMALAEDQGVTAAYAMRVGLRIGINRLAGKQRVTGAPMARYVAESEAAE